MQANIEAHTSSNKRPNNCSGANDEDQHKFRRYFIGPMPEQVATGASLGKEQKKKIRGLGLSRSTGSALQETSSKPYHASTLDAIDREHTFQFFINEGGKPEEFAVKERGVRDEIRRRLRESRWLPVLKQEQEQQKTPLLHKRWVGDTFEIGTDILGLSLLPAIENEPPVIGRSNYSTTGKPNTHPESSQSLTKHSSSRGINDSPRSLEALNVTTHEMPDISLEKGFPTSKVINNAALSHPESNKFSSTPSTDHGNKLGSSQTHSSESRPAFPVDLASQARSDGALLQHSNKTILKKTNSMISLQGEATASPQDAKGKGKVMFADTLKGNFQPSPPTDLVAASPSEVLLRDPPPNTSAEAATRVQDELEPSSSSDILIRDRMLARVLSTKGGISKYLDEAQLMEMPQVRKDHSTMWKEYQAVWRKNRIELYESYGILGKEWMTGHMHLSFIIPLQRTETTVSIFSHVDMTLAVTCPTSSVHLHIPHMFRDDDKQSTMIFILKTKSRSRSVDWLWRLWRVLGGEIPEIIEIRCPVLEARVDFPIPAIDLATGEEGYKSFTRERVIENCRTHLCGVPDWEMLIEEPLKNGAKLELCWRSGSKLDWAWLEEDVDGKYRPWAILFGLAGQNPRLPSELELRVAEHGVTKIHMGNGQILHEPTSVEGYVYRYKTETHIRDPAYISTHSGCIYILSPSHAYPPPPPTTTFKKPVAPVEESAAAKNLTDQTTESSPEHGITRASEVVRGTKQVLNAKHVLDMRMILAVRRAKEPWISINQPGYIGSLNRRRSTATETSGTSGTAENVPSRVANTQAIHLNDVDIDVLENETEQPELNEEDAADEGGDDVLEALTTEEQKLALKTRRSFEIVMNGGEVVRFEAYSCRTAFDWVQKLRDLVSFWVRKQRMEAKLEMDIVHALSGRTRFLVPRVGEHVYPAPPPDPREASPLLGNYWNWCVLENCRPITRSGRLFMRTKIHGEMRHFYFVLTGGHLLRFHLSKSRTALHSHAKTINLLDAFVTSGYFAALEVDHGDNSGVPSGRRFQDGLETNDSDKDTLIIIRYKSHLVDKLVESTESNRTSARSLSDSQKPSGQPNLKVPKLNGKRKLLILRARSRLERDGWCWALNSEIERLVRLHSAREAVLRETGTVRNP